MNISWNVTLVQKETLKQSWGYYQLFAEYGDAENQQGSGFNE